MTKYSRISLPVTAFALLIAGVTTPRALASGFQLREQSASAQGTAFAGVAARGSDISTMFFNPATLTNFDGFQLVLGATNIAPKAELGNSSATRAALPGALAPLGGSAISGPVNYGNAAKSATLPEVYALWSVNKDLKLGLSVNAPFGLVTEYGNDFKGRYHALKSDLKVIDIGLNAAYRINPMWSVGASVISRKVDATLSTAVDVGEITYLSVMSQLALVPAGSPQAAAIAAAAAPFNPATSNGAFDAKSTVTGSKSVIGYKAGLTFEPNSLFRAGLGYQSATKVKVEGNVHYDYATTTAANTATMMSVVNGGHLVDGSTNAEVDLPDTLSLGLSWDVSPVFNLAFEADRTGWSKFQELRFKFGSGQADSVTEENWHNTTFVSLGATWKVTDVLSLRAGLAKDQGAVDTAYRTPRIPDADRTWMSLGLGYAFTKNFNVDLAYTHILVDDGDVALTAGASSAAPNYFRGNLSGTFKNSIDIMAVHASFKF